MNAVRSLLGVVAAALLCVPASANGNNEDAKAAPKKGGTVKGVVKVSGKAPRRKKIRMTADPKCAALHASAPYADDIVVDKATGAVQWAFVYVKSDVAGSFETPSTPVTINQKGCRYEPHVFGVMTNQDILIKNSDDLLHNIHALPFNNKEFNFGQPQKGMTETKKFTTKEVMVKIKCDVHPWMSAWAGVLPHPFHATTNEKGEFEIKGLPAGEHTLEVWHERYKSVEVKVTVADGATATQNLELKDQKGR